MSDDEWQALLDRLIDWATAASTTDEDGYLSPTQDAISSAFKLLNFIRQSNLARPKSVVSDGDGGIALERRTGEVTQRFEVDANGHVEYVLFRDCHLIQREEFKFETEMETH